MKTKIGIIMMAVCIILICLGATAFLVTRESDTRQTSGDDKIEALEWGFKFASAIPIKPHIDDRSKSQYQIIKIYLERDMPNKASEYAGDIADWRECLSYADLAEYFAREDHVKNVSLYSKRARECSDRLLGWEASWQRDRVLLRIAEAQVNAGQWKAAEKISTELPAESVDLFHTLQLRHMDSPDDYEKKVEQLKSMENSEHMEVKRDVAKAYVAILEQLGREARIEQCSTLQNRVYTLTEELPQLLQHEILCSLSQTVFSIGREGMGRKILEYAEEQLKRRELKARYDVNTLTVLAGIWDQEAQDPQRADSLLHEAKDLLIKDHLKGTDHVRALIALAQAYGLHGNHDVVWDYFRQAIQAASLQVNARPRAMNLTEICAAIGKWDVPWPDDMAKEIVRLYEALGDPW